MVSKVPLVSKPHLTVRTCRCLDLWLCFTRAVSCFQLAVLCSQACLRHGASTRMCARQNVIYRIKHCKFIIKICWGGLKTRAQLRYSFLVWKEGIMRTHLRHKLPTLQLEATWCCRRCWIRWRQAHGLQTERNERDVIALQHWAGNLVFRVSTTASQDCGGV